MNSECLISISDAFSGFVYGYLSSCPCAHCTPSKSVPTLHYTHRPGPIYTGHACRHLLSAVPWISKDCLLYPPTLPSVPKWCDGASSWAGRSCQKLGRCFLYCAGAARVWRGWRHYTIGLFEHTTASSAFYVQLATTLEKVKIHLQIQCWMFRSCTLLLCVSVRTRADVRKLKVYL